MFEAKKEALKYIVHISYDKDSEGSGVIVPIQEQEYSYVLTAKHTFGKDEKEQGDFYDKIKKTNIDPKKITLTTSSEESFDVEEVFILEDEPQLDFLIIKIRNNLYLNNLSQLDIYEEDFNYCLSYGYPDLAKEGHTKYEPFNCEYKPIISTDKLEIRIIDYMSVKANKGTDSYMSGISGAGVFVENYSKDKIYLAGIVIQGTEIIKQTMVCLDLEKLSKKINNALLDKEWETLKISGAEWRNKFGFDMSGLDFGEEIREFKEKSKNQFIKALKDVPLEKFSDKFDREVKSELKKEEEKFQKISESYLYIGMNFHQLQAHKRATHYLNKAIEYGGNKNKLYLLDAKSKRDNQELLVKQNEYEKELILELINSLYQEIYEYEEQLKYNLEDESIKRLLIELYDKLIDKLKIFNDRKDELLEINERLIKLYSGLNEFSDVKNKMVKLESIVALQTDSTINMTTQVNDYKSEIKNLNKHIQLLSTHVSDKTILNQINYKVFNTNKKLDTFSINLSKKIDMNTDKISKEMDELEVNITRTNSQKLNNFLKTVYRTNQALIAILLLGLVGSIGYLAFEKSKNNKNISPLEVKIEEINSTNQEKVKENLEFYTREKSQELIVNDATSIDDNISDTNSSIVLIEEDINTTEIVEEKKKNCEVGKIYIVKKGDILGNIAQKCYGKFNKYNKIISANKEIKNKNSILHIGQKIYIPK